MLVTTAMLFGAARVLLSGGRVPAGGLTVLFGVVALLVSVAFDEDAEGVAAALAAGVALDILLAAQHNRRQRAGVLAAMFGLVSAGLWLLYMGLLGVLEDGLAA